MKKLLLALPLLLTACGADPRGAAEALDNAGFTDIQTGGYSVFACGKGDTYHTAFTAKNPRGKTVTGTVCSGWFKGATIRFD